MLSPIIMTKEAVKDLADRINAARRKINKEIGRHLLVSYYPTNAARNLKILNFKLHCLTIVYLSLRRFQESDGSGESSLHEYKMALELLKATEDTVLTEDFTKSTKDIKEILEERLRRHLHRRLSYIRYPDNDDNDETTYE